MKNTFRTRTSSGTRAAARSRAASSIDVIHLVISTTEEGSADAVPRSITLIHSSRGSGSDDQLILDKTPIPRELWNYHRPDGVLTWRGPYGGGHLLITHGGKVAIGNVRLGLTPIAITAGATAAFDCRVAAGCGIQLVSDGKRVTGMLWDETSTAWTDAEWSSSDRLLLEYTYTPGSPIDPGSTTFQFTDDDTAQVWAPLESEISASFKLGMNPSGGQVWKLSLLCDDDPPRSAPSEAIDTVFPYWLIAREDAAASSITGVLLIDSASAETGAKIGFQGVASTANITGYYRVGNRPLPFAVFAGKLVVAGRTIATSRIRGQRLAWSDLTPEDQSATGLPERGALNFRRDGESGSGSELTLRVRRLSASAAIQALKAQDSIDPRIARHLADSERALSDPALTIQSLLVMTPYAQNTSGEYFEAVQQAVTADLGVIMNSFISSDVWNLLYPSTPQPTLSGRLAEVAQTPVKGENVQEWYQSLSTAVVTQGLAGGTDDNCKYLNGPRAAQWLRSKVASSKVYAAHSQILFAFHWQDKNALTAEYLQDQIDNAGSYIALINSAVTSMVADIQDNVAVDPTVPDPRPNMIADVQAAGEYASSENLFWAFGFYHYNTSKNVLATLAAAMSDPGSTDGSMLSRLFQTNITVLTALDPSGTFAQNYTNVLNSFLATNILPNMSSLSADASDVSLIKYYLQQFVENNIANADKAIAAAAAALQALVDDHDFDATLKASIEAIDGFSGAIDDALAFPYVAKNFVNWFETTYPKFATCSKFFGSVLMGGIVALNAFNIIMDFKSWDKLSEEERAELVTNTIQMGLQVLAAVVKRAVRVEAILTVDGLTGGQRAASIAKIIAEGEGGALENALVRTGNATARWLGSTEGTAMIDVSVDGAVQAVMINGADAAAEDAGWVVRAFGKNLDEFVATRIGPVFILAGIGFSLYSIIEGDRKIALAGDILSIVSGALTLFALAGNWAIASAAVQGTECCLAAFVPFAGPLAVLAALAGVALMIYEMTQHPPDPVAEFVDDYARPAGFKVNSECGSIDYVAPFANVDDANTMMMGFTLGANGSNLSCASDGAITWTSKTTSLPDTVWQVQTDGSGFSQIFTLGQPDTTKSPVVLLLTLMSDGTVTFQVKMPPPSGPSARSVGKLRIEPPSGPTIQTQTWQCNTASDASLTSDRHLAAISLTIQPAVPDANGNYQPSGWLMGTTQGLTTGNSGTVFDLRVSGMAPNFMQMRDIAVLANTAPSKTQTFGPMYGVQPSTPLTFTASAAPSFIAFDSASGTFSPNGTQSGSAATTPMTLTATNPLSAQSVDFSILVKAAAV